MRRRRRIIQQVLKCMCMNHLMTSNHALATLPLYIGRWTRWCMFVLEELQNILMWLLLLFSCPRSASVIACTDGFLWVLDGSVFRRINGTRSRRLVVWFWLFRRSMDGPQSLRSSCCDLLLLALKSNREIARVLRRVDILQSLSLQQLSTLCDAFAEEV